MVMGGYGVIIDSYMPLRVVFGGYGWSSGSNRW